METEYAALLRGLLEEYGQEPWLESKLYPWRMMAAQEYGWAIPTSKLIDTLALEAGGILEVGAGSGYLAHLVQKAGGTIIPTDSGAWKFKKHWTEVEVLSGSEAATKYKDEVDTVLCAWPYFEEEGDALLDALRAHKFQTVILIGEGRHGCTGTDALFDILTYFYTLEYTPMGFSGVLSWPGVSDYVQFWEKKP